MGSAATYLIIIKYKTQINHEKKEPATDSTTSEQNKKQAAHSNYY